METLLRPDPWLSEVMGRRAYQLRLPLAPLEVAQAETIAREVSDAAGFCTAKVPADDVRTLWSLEQVGFRLVTTSVTLEKALEPGARDGAWADRVRMAEPSDRADVVRVAFESFIHSRLHVDPLIDDEVADASRAAWVESAFDGDRGDAVLVATDASTAMGFSVLLTTDDGSLCIDLIAVDPVHRGKGVASDLIRAGEALCGRGHTRYRVVTQASNVSSVRLYERAGFRMTSAAQVLHFHGSVER